MRQSVRDTTRWCTTFTLLNASSQDLKQVPVVMAKPGFVFGSVQTLTAGQSIGLDARALRLKKRGDLELKGILWIYGSSQTEAWKQFSKLSQQSKEVLVQANTEAGKNE